MGGGQTLNFGFPHTDVFHYIGAFSSAPNSRQPAQNITNPATVQQNVNVIFIACGDADGLFGTSEGYHNFLDTNAIDHIWQIEYGGGHDPVVWNRSLYHFAQRIFRDRDPGVGGTGGMGGMGGMGTGGMGASGGDAGSGGAGAGGAGGAAGSGAGGIAGGASGAAGLGGTAGVAGSGVAAAGGTMPGVGGSGLAGSPATGGQPTGAGGTGTGVTHTVSADPGCACAVPGSRSAGQAWPFALCLAAAGAIGLRSLRKRRRA
jgi:hypothetical protein